MKGIILAAGDGGRLQPLTRHTPKVLLNVGGHPLIHWPLTAMLSAGITEIGVVVGHNGQAIVDALACEERYNGCLEFIENPHWQGGNAVSLHAAHSFAGGEPVLLCMGDHAISPEILSRLLATEHEGSVLCIDSQPWHPSQINDATRVAVGPEGFVVAIGKQLTRWTAVDAGVFKLDAEVFDSIGHLRKGRDIHVEMSEVVRLYGKRNNPFLTCDIAGAFWADVDTVEDFEAIKSWLREHTWNGI